MCFCHRLRCSSHIRPGRDICFCGGSGSGSGRNSRCSERFKISFCRNGRGGGSHGDWLPRSPTWESPALDIEFVLRPSKKTDEYLGVFF